MSWKPRQFGGEKGTRWRVLAAAVVMLVLPVVCQAGIILGQHDWEDGAEGWQSLEGWTTVTDPAGDGWLGINFPTTTAPESGQDEWYDVAYVEAEDLFAGTWTEDMFVEFDFWAEDTAPTSLQLQWSSSTNSDIWASVLNYDPVTQSWDRVTAGFSDWEDWMFPGTTEDQYLSDLSSIDWIGIYIARDGAGAQEYRVDNFSLMIPEPTQVTMLASALVTSLLAVRRRRKGRGGGDTDDTPAPHRC